MFIISQSNYKLKIDIITGYFSDCSCESALIEDILTVKCKVGGNKVNKVFEIKSDASLHNSFIKQNKLHAIFYSPLLIGKKNISEVR